MHGDVSVRFWPDLRRRELPSQWVDEHLVGQRQRLLRDAGLLGNRQLQRECELHAVW